MPRLQIAARSAPGRNGRRADSRAVIFLKLLKPAQEIKSERVDVDTTMRLHYDVEHTKWGVAGAKVPRIGEKKEEKKGGGGVTVADESDIGLLANSSAHAALAGHASSTLRRAATLLSRPRERKTLVPPPSRDKPDREVARSFTRAVPE